MTINRLKKLRLILVTLLIFITSINLSFAAFNDEVDSFLDGMGLSGNSTSPSSWEGKTAEYYSMGGYYARTPIKNINPVTVRLPEFRAGCGGIDIYAGGFSFINEDQFIALANAIAANAAGFGAKMGLALICPMCEKIMSELQEVANKVNNFNINSCDVAKGVIGGLASLNDTTSRAFCKTRGNSSGQFTDYASAAAGCDNEGRAGSQSYSKEEKNAGAPPINLVWRILTKNNGDNLSAADKQYYELLMSMVGTITISNGNPPNIISKDPLAVKEETINILMNGGTLKVLSCNDALDCMSVSETSVQITDTNSFKGRVKNMIQAIKDKIANEEGGSDVSFTVAEQDFISNAPYGLPILKIIETQQSYKKFDSIFSLDGLEDWMALNLVYQFLGGLVNEVESYSHFPVSVGQEQREVLVSNIRFVREKIMEESRKVDYQITSLSNQVNAVRQIEDYLNQNSLLTGLTQQR